MNVPPVLVVTGTDTGVGKTVVTAALAASLAPDRSVAVLKPVQTGAASSDPADTDEVRRLSGVHTVREGVRLRAPLAPVAAARLERAQLPPIGAHVTAVNELARTHDVVLVEGSGGLLVDLDADGNGLCELAAATSAAVSFVVVTRPTLGTLNHSRLTVEALRARDFPVSGLVVGAVPAEPGLAEQSNLADLPEVTATPVVGHVPAGAASLDPLVFRSRARGWLSLEGRP
jgi:dethiobiotin synthase